MRKMNDITGQKFRMLTALYPTDKRGHKGTVLWHCRCECGKELDVDYNKLLYTGLVSCGCKKKEDNSHMDEKLTRVAGTTVELVRSSHARAGSRAGVKGVSYCSSKNVYRAEICFQGHKYRLGAYKHLDDAAAVRKQAEEELLEPFLEYYEQYSNYAKQHTGWAEQNPIETDINHLGGGKFRIAIQPDMHEFAT